jgi:hypothetical protein
MSREAITLITTKLRHAGLHCYPEVNIPSVDYLRYPHRHVFHITCKKQVSHGDREIEIITFKNEIDEWLTEQFKGDFGRMSCEHIAVALTKRFNLSYCEVLEDGENGAETYDYEFLKTILNDVTSHFNH